MAAIGGIVSAFVKIFPRINTVPNVVYNHQQLRNYNPTKYVDARMLRDVKRRKLAKDFAPLRLRLMSLKRNDVLPIEIRELAEQHMQKYVPRQTSQMQLTRRCVMTSRPRGNVPRWRLSRFIFRNMVDYNGRLAGIQRALWG